MRSVSICLPYYENAGMLKRHLDNLAGLHSAVRSLLELVVVDDCSPDHSMSAFLAAQEWRGANIAGECRFPVDFKLFRMAHDIPWNQDACRNLAAREAAHDWLLLTDIDHLPTARTLTQLTTDGVFFDNAAYTFARVSEPELNPYKPHPNSYFMRRSLYDKVGGYDERFAGTYGTDGKFRRDLRRVAMAIVPTVLELVRVPRHVTPDASTTSLVRKSPESDRMRAEIAARIARLPLAEQRPQRYLFEYERVL